MDNVGPYTPRYIFNTNGAEQARVGDNRFWRIGENPTSIDGNRRLEVVDFNTPQFRISSASNTTGLGYRYTDFMTTTAGYLKINPENGRVGINLAIIGNPTHNLDINGNVRIRNVNTGAADCILIGANISNPSDNEVRRLDFTGNANDVLLGNGTWGPAAGSVSANNGATVVSNTVQWGQVNSGNASINGGELLHDTEIPMNNFNVFFREPVGGAYTMNRFQVGNYNGSGSIISDPSLTSRLTVTNEGPSSSATRIGGFFATSSTYQPYSILPVSVSPTYFGNITPNYRIGLVSVAVDAPNTPKRNIGVSGGAYNSEILNIGVSGKAAESPNQNIGLYGFAYSSQTSATNYGIYATAGGFGQNWAGFFGGNVYTTGTYQASDAILKQNIQPIESGLSLLLQLQPKAFTYNPSFPYNLPDGEHLGFIAQDVQLLLPNAVRNAVYPDVDSVSDSEISVLSLNYNEILPLAVAAIQEQQLIIEDLNTELTSQDSINNALQQQIDQLSQMINDCCTNTNRQNENGNNGVSYEITLSDIPSVILDQNVPNPFAEMTTINYTLTDGIRKAQLLFYDASGKLINSVDIEPVAGKGRVNVFAQDLSNGIYTYTLIVDGKVSDTKKMVRQK